MQSTNPNLPRVIDDCHELLKWLIPVFDKFPRARRFTLGERLESGLLSVDRAGYFYSDRVHCALCCETQHRDGRVSYYHQLLGAALVHPGQRVVLSLAYGATPTVIVPYDTS